MIVKAYQLQPFNVLNNDDLVVTVTVGAGVLVTIARPGWLYRESKRVSVDPFSSGDILCPSLNELIEIMTLEYEPWDRVRILDR